MCAALALPAASLQAQEADLIVRNARIWTGDSIRPRAEALAVRGERLIAVGTNAQADAHRSAATRVIDAGGRFVTPGFIDDHTHFAQAGALLIGANLLDVHTAGPFAERVRAAAQRMSPGAWLTGGDWGAYEDFEEAARRSPDSPGILFRLASFVQGFNEMPEPRWRKNRARGLYEDVLERSPLHTEALVALARILHGEDKTEEALKGLKELPDEGEAPEDPEAARAGAETRAAMERIVRQLGMPRMQTTEAKQAYRAGGS